MLSGKKLPLDRDKKMRIFGINSLLCNADLYFLYRLHNNLIEMAETKKRVSRTIAVEENVYYRIVDMSERLGVNVNAYLLEAIGQKLFRDESLLRTEKVTSDAMNNMVSSIQDAISQKNPNE